MPEDAGPQDADAERHPHIAFEREPDIEPERRKHGFGTRPPTRPPQEHGTAIQRGVAAAASNITRKREALAIAPDRLIVVEFHSWDSACRDVFEERFHASVVDERLVQDDTGELTRVLVQFPSREIIGQLEREAKRYREEEPEETQLPPGIRRDFFDGLERVDEVSRGDRIGSRLRSEGYPDEQPFAMDVDLWHPGTDAGARESLDNLRQICRRHGVEITDELRTTSLVLARVTASARLADVLLDLDLVAQVNLPPALPTAYGAIFDDVDPLPDHAAPHGDEPVVGVLDSGVLAGHPLLRGWVVEEIDLSEEGTAVDLHGHGTQVAGLAVYGDIARCIDSGSWEPQVLIASAKVLQRDQVFQDVTVFPEHRRPDAVVDQAIRLLHRERGCRVFNLSAGNRDDVYAAGRQFAWAEVLDRLARELDVVIVVAAGNESDPVMPHGAHTREGFQAGVRDATLSNPSARILNPATASIAVTVGSIARSEAPRTADSFAGAPRGAPAPFSRVGPGYESKPTQRSVKPDFVAYGGNLAVSQFAGGRPRWVERDIHLGEPTTRLNTDGGRLLTAVNGTSFAAPHVSNAAALALEAVATARGEASANAARALLGVAAQTPPCGDDWLRDPKAEGSWERLRLAGFGMVNVERVRESLSNDVCLLASDDLEEDRCHIYEVVVPPAFVSGRGERGIVVALAYDPPVRASRREYLGRTMWIEVLKGLTRDDVIRYRTRYEGPDKPPKIPQSKILDCNPARTPLQWSTLQVRGKRWTRAPKLPSAGQGAESILHLLVGCQSRYRHGEGANQRYSIALRFWQGGEEVDLYQQIHARVRLRAVVAPRAIV